MVPKLVDWKKVAMNPDNTFKRTENCNYVIQLCNEMKLDLKGISGKNIVDGNPNLTLGNIIIIVVGY